MYATKIHRLLLLKFLLLFHEMTDKLKTLSLRIVKTGLSFYNFKKLILPISTQSKTIVNFNNDYHDCIKKVKIVFHKYFLNLLYILYHKI